MMQMKQEETCACDFEHDECYECIAGLVIE